MITLQSIYLDKNYTAYLQGAEVESATVDGVEPWEPGQHVMVFKDSIAASSTIAVPAEKESQSIGVEGMITQVNVVKDLKNGDTIQQLKLKRI